MDVGNLRHEVVDVGVPLAIVGGGEEQPRVVVQEHEAHVVERADRVGALEVAFQQLQQAAKSFRSTFRERKDPGELRDLALTRADRDRRFAPLSQLPALACEMSASPFSSADLAQLRCVGVKLLQLLNLLLDRLLLLVRSFCLAFACSVLLLI